MKSRSSCSVDLQISGGEVADQRSHGTRLPEQGPVGLELATVTDGLRQLGPQLVVPRVGELGQLVDHPVVRDHGQVLLVPRDVGDGKADGREYLLVNSSYISF